MEFTFRKAAPEDAQDILTLYRSHIGAPGCTWRLEYPDEELLTGDIAAERQYVALCDGVLAAVASAEPSDEDLDTLDCWDCTRKHVYSLSRVGAALSFEGRGAVAALLRHIEREMVARGFDGVRLIAGTQNTRAQRLYAALAFRRCGDAHLFDHDWICYEKIL